MKRRSLLRWLLALPPGLLIIRWGVPYVARLAGSAWKRELHLLATDYREELNAVTEALLPSSLGRARADAVATDYVKWLEQQDPEAELNHLGVMLRRKDLASLRPGMRRAVIGASKYLAQLDALAKQTRAGRLAGIGRVNLATILTLSLQAAGAQEIPPAPNGEDLLLDILSFFYTRPSAPDFFHGRRIGALTCRGLQGVDAVPDSLTASTRS